MARRPKLLTPQPPAEHPCHADLPRRAFCAATAAALGLAACGGDPTRLNMGGIAPDGDAGTSETTDAAQHQQSGDMASTSQDDLATSMSNPDLAQPPNNSCAAATSGGSAASITAASPKYISSAHVYVCRDSGGLYAMSSLCTHAGCKVTLDTTQWYCGCHGATFDLNGQNPTSPAFSPLKHYEMCVDGSGNVQVNTSKTVSASTRV